MSRPTPETEKIKGALHTNWDDLLAYARKLERERDDLQKAVNGLCEHFGVNPANTTLLAVEILKIESERDEAREQIDQYRDKLDLSPISWE